MKKIGFICEGKSDRLILESTLFSKLLSKLNLQSVLVKNVEGNGNLLPDFMDEHLSQMKDYKAEFVLILTDLDEDQCITKTKERINPHSYLSKFVFIVLSVKSIESWFLADSETMSSIFRKNFHFPLPEKTEGKPFDIIKAALKNNMENSRGVGSKSILASLMLKHGFSIENASRHPNCPSATYFLSKLQEISSS